MTVMEKEFAECRQGIGEKMLVMERDSIERLTRIETVVESIEKRIPEWITRLEFTPVKLIVYGMVVIILTAVLTAVVALVVAGGVR
jgi:hypothetical protein